MHVQTDKEAHWLTYLHAPTGRCRLGLSWLDDEPSFDDFMQVATSSLRRAPARPLAVFLMDQTKTAGIGNYLLSEILYATGTHPWARLGDVEPLRWRLLYDAALRTIRASYLEQLQDYYQAAQRTDKEGPSLAVADDTGYHVAGSPSSAVSSSIPLSYEERRTGEAYEWQVYRQVTCPEGLSVRREEGPHGRTVHWIPERQVGAKPPDSGELLHLAPAVAKPPRAARGGKAAAASSPQPLREPLHEPLHETPPAPASGVSGVDNVATAAMLTSWTVPQLKEACRERGLRVGGRKAELVVRLLPHLPPPAAADAPDSEPRPESAT